MFPITLGLFLVNPLILPEPFNLWLHAFHLLTSGGSNRVPGVSAELEGAACHRLSVSNGDVTFWDLLSSTAALFTPALAALVRLLCALCV